MSAPGAGVTRVCERLRTESGPSVRAAFALTTEPTFLAPTVEAFVVCILCSLCFP